MLTRSLGATDPSLLTAVSFPVLTSSSVPALERQDRVQPAEAFVQHVDFLSVRAPALHEPSHAAEVMDQALRGELRLPLLDPVAPQVLVEEREDGPSHLRLACL